MNTIVSVAVIGVGATALTDLWSILRRVVFGVPPPDFGLVGRWIGHMPSGRLRHAAIADAPALRHERALGWVAHYVIGIGFACLLPVLFGGGWIASPTVLPALVVGAATVCAPLLLLHPGMGLGLAARRTRFPWRVRLHSLVTHLVFGAGLYLTAAASRLLASI